MDSQTPRTALLVRGDSRANWRRSQARRWLRGLETSKPRFHLTPLGQGRCGSGQATGAVSMTADPRRWMWAEACAMIERAEQLHRQFFQPAFATAALASWEPPVDVFEGD